MLDKLAKIKKQKKKKEKKKMQMLIGPPVPKELLLKGLAERRHLKLIRNNFGKKLH